MREQRKLAAIVTADLVGYSRLMGRDESGTVARLRSVRAERLEPILANHGGRLVKLTGDGALIEFASAVEALAATIELQQAMAESEADRPEAERLIFRIGVHLGDVIVDGEDLYGDGVNVAARLEAEASPGGMVISGAVHEATAGRLKATFEDLGRLRLKNIERPVQAYAVRWQACDWPATPSTAAGPPPPAHPASSAAPLALPDKPSIAVLPFQNMSGDAEQEYFADGVVEDIITALSRFKSLFVIARNSSFTYKGRAVDIKQVGRELGVRYVLEGSIRKAANRVRVTGQLIEAETRSHIWADRFDGSLEDIFALQDEMTTRVVYAIGPKLDLAEMGRAVRKSAESLDAYDLFLRGVAAMYKWDTKESILDSLRLFHRAMELDPNFSAPCGMATRCYSALKNQGWLDDVERAVAETRRLASHVSVIGQDDAQALAIAGQALVRVCRDYEAGEQMIDLAIAVNENLAIAWQMRAWVSLALGQHEAAIEQVSRVLRLSPLDPNAARSYAILAYANLHLGRFEETLKWTALVASREPTSNLSLRTAIVANALGGDLDEARHLARKMHELDPGMRLSRIREFFAYRRPDDLAVLMEGFRKAGLPE